jgi:hypothetical protein
VLAGRPEAGGEQPSAGLEHGKARAKERDIDLIGQLNHLDWGDLAAREDNGSNPPAMS